MMNRTLAVAWTAILLSGAPNDGRAQPIADKPEYRPGDSWFFHRTDTKDGKFDKWRLRVEAIESPDRIATRLNKREVFCDSALNPLRGGRDDAARLLVRYPLRVGDEWTFSITFEHPGVVELGRAKVAAYESLTVPAGTFQCYRVEAESSYGSRYYTKYELWTRWYCPEIKWFAKQVLTTRTHSIVNPASNGESTATSVLTTFLPAP